jgi:chemotaxis response regulator CheB
MFGSHSVKSWSTTQQVIALSSGEAEYYSMVKGGSMGLGIQAMARDLGVSISVNVKTDASAAKGIASRRGLGKVRHIDVSQLWLQDRVSKGEIIIEKVSTHNNIADAMTKHVDSGKLNSHMLSVGLVIVQSRHELMPES